MEGGFKSVQIFKLDFLIDNKNVHNFYDIYPSF